MVVNIFISKNIDTDITSLLLKKVVFNNTTIQELIEQIEAKKRCKKKKCKKLDIIDVSWYCAEAMKRSILGKSLKEL